jgi:uncharacterized membrane protein
MNDTSKQSTPVPQGVAGLIAYFLPIIGGLLFLFLERENKLVRFHAVQSILLWIFFIIISAIFSWIPGLNILLWLFILIVWIFMMYQALMERQFELPVIGRIARKQAFGETEEGKRDEE